MRPTVWLCTGSALVLAVCLAGNLLPEPAGRLPFELSGDPVWEASRSIAEDFPAQPVRFPVFHFPDSPEGNALSHEVLAEAWAGSQRLLADSSCAAALLPAQTGMPGVPPLPAGLGLAPLIALQAGGEIPPEPALTLILDQMFAMRLPDGRQPLRELVSPDLRREENGWHAAGLVSELRLDPELVSEDLELLVAATLRAEPSEEGPPAAVVMSFAGLQHAIAQQIEETGPLIGLAICIMLLVVGVYFRNLRDLAAAGAGLFLLMGSLSGLRKLLGFAESQLSAMLPILLLALGVDVAIHSLQRLQSERRAGTRRPYSKAVRGMAAALLLATATSAVAFGSNTLAGVADLREWGILAALGMGLTYLSLGLIVPALRMAMRAGATASSASDSVPEPIPFAVRQRKLLLLGSLLLVALAGLFLGDLRSGFDVEDFLAADVPYVQAVQRVALVFDNSGEPADILIRGALDSAEARAAVRAIGLQLAAEGLAWPREMGEALTALDEGAVSPYVLRRDGQVQAFRLPVFVYQAGVWQSIARAQERIEAVSAPLDLLPEVDSRVLTGAPFLRYAFVNALTRAVRSGIPLTLGLCFVLALLAFGELRLAVLAMVPVLAICVCLQAGMALLGFRLNLVTVQVAALAIGLGGDYMLHYLMRFRQLGRERPGADVPQLLAATHAETGKALLGSAVSTLLGFAVLAFAPMPLFASFGRIQSLMIVLSLLAALGLLPALVASLYRITAPAATVSAPPAQVLSQEDA